MIDKVFSQIIDSDNFVKTCDKVHSEIHSGSMYTYSASVTVVATSTYFMMLTSSGARPHYTFALTSSAAATMSLYESPTAASTWATTTVYNRYRDSTNTATTALRLAVPSSDVTSTGTLLEAVSVGGGTTPASRFGGSEYTRNEWILKSSAQYLVMITSASTNTLTFSHQWYEE